MEKLSLLSFFEVLMSKTKSSLLPKNKVSRLYSRRSNLCYFSPKVQNTTRNKTYSYGSVTKSVTTGLSFSFKSALILAAVSFFGFTTATAQTFPGLSYCTSKDLELISVTLPPPSNDICNCSGTRNLILGIRNKTGSTRTSFAFWGTLIRRNANGDPVDDQGNLISEGLPVGTKIFACAAGIKKSSDNFLPATSGTTQITIACNQTLEIVDLYLAWTSSSPNETCDVLYNNPSTINPKCGTLPFIKIGIGVDATLTSTVATCTTGGSITVSPSGGKAPYLISKDGSEYTNTTTFLNLEAGNHSFIIKDDNGCTTTKTKSVGASEIPTVSAGTDFTKTCIANKDGGTIGEATVDGFTYSWVSSPAGFTSSISNPSVNPTETTTYTVTKTNTASGCDDTDDVTVIVNNTVVTANAGTDFTKTCAAHTNGGEIGEAAVDGFTYSWVSSPAGFTSSISNPSVNPTETTTYTVTKTNTASGCDDTDDVTVTVNNTAVTANAGTDFTKTCAAHTNGGEVGEATLDGFTYSWVSSPSGFTSSISNPSVNPTETTTYTVTKTNTTSGCYDTDDVTVTVNNTAVTANAGTDFTKTCIANKDGGSIGEAAVDGFTYSWVSSPSGFTSSISNPSVNPTMTTTYTVTKTNTASGCFNTDNVTVTVNNTAVTASAGTDFTKTCAAHTNGGSIGEAAVDGFTYSWVSSPAGFTSTDSNPSVNPTMTTTYTVTKTNMASGCYDADDVTVTVNNTAVTASAGTDFTKTCAAHIDGGSIGEAAVDGFTYSWVSSPAGFTSTDSNPSVNPDVTTTYTVTKTNTDTGCYDTDDVKVIVDTDIPDFPTFCAIQPSLCGPATGSVTIISPASGTGYEYSIDNGKNWQTSTVFSDLAAGSVTGIKVKNTNTGCVSGPADCDASNCQSPAKIADPEAKKTEAIIPVETTITSKTENVGFDAYPVPFKDQLTIKYKFDYVSNVLIEMFDTNGHKVISKEDINSYLGKEVVLDYNFNKGTQQVYIVRLTTIHGHSEQKVMSSY